MRLPLKVLIGALSAVTGAMAMIPVQAELVFVGDNAAASWPDEAPVRTSIFPEPTATRGVRGDRIQAQTFQVTETISVQSLFLAYGWVGGTTAGDPALNFTKIRIVEVDDVFKAGVYEGGNVITNQLSISIPSQPEPNSASSYYAIRADWDSTNGPLILSPRTGNQGYAVEITGTFVGAGSSAINLIERQSVDGALYPLGRAYERIGAAASGPYGAGNYDFPLAITAVPEPVLNGDLNGDGFVGQDDLNAILGNWGQPVTSGDLLAGDPSGDGFVGQDDLNFVLGGWGQGTPPVAAVPEPGTMLLALLAIGGIVTTRKLKAWRC